MADNENPLIQALPPKSDYLTYLTIVEYNLSTQSLPILHKVLQDEKLTTNIGWDLVHILVPYLPESELCLRDIAHFGNPREVILKVTEVLRGIQYDHADDEDDDLESDAKSDDARERADSSTYPLKTAATSDGIQLGGSSQAVELPPPLPLPIEQFIALLSMLTVLHGRIRTKKPSAFLSTSLQAILESFSNSSTHREKMIESIVKFVKTLSGVQRPSLPSRKSSGTMSSAGIIGLTSRADPEGSDDQAPDSQDRGIQRKLLQAFVTHVVEEYMLTLPQYDDVPGMAWCSRIMEKVHPERNVPGALTFADRFHGEEKLELRIDAVGQLVSLAKDLEITDEDLLETAITVEKIPGHVGEEEDPPTSAEEIPLSRLGSVILYAARQASTILYESSKPEDSRFALFPDLHELLKNCLASADLGAGQLGTEPEALVDSVLAIAITCLEKNSIGAPATDEDFNHYLQTLAFLSSNCPNANLRGHAHYVTTTVLRSQPDDKVRLDFIRDTLEHCPFENLKVSAVGWIKGETIEANSSTLLSGQEPSGHTSGEDGDAKSIFASPLALDSLGPFLFPSIQAEVITAPVDDAWLEFQTNISFWLASLNFLYLLLTAKHVHGQLEIADLWQNNDVAGSFLQPLRDASARFSGELQEGGSLVLERNDNVLAELSLLDETVKRVTKAAVHLNDA